MEPRLDQVIYEDVKDALLDIVAECPEYIDARANEDCMYFNPFDGTPSCIVGHYFDRVGVMFPDLAGSNGQTVRSLFAGHQDIESGAWVEGLFPNADEKATEFLALVQTAQDRGVSWGQAVQDAVAQVEA